MAEMSLRKFEEWLKTEGRSPATVANYSYAIRRYLKGVAPDQISTESLDQYAASLSSIPRNAFRSAWRALAFFAGSQHIDLPNVSPGRLGRPLARNFNIPSPANFVLAYLARAIELSRFRDLRWADVAFTGGVEATITDPVERKVYRVHRRPMEILLRWGFPADGGPRGALAPNAPGEGGWMSREELEERIESARDAKFMGVCPNPEVAFILALPPPRVEPYAPSPKPPRIDSGVEEA